MQAVTEIAIDFDRDAVSTERGLEFQHSYPSGFEDAVERYVFTPSLPVWMVSSLSVAFTPLEEDPILRDYRPRTPLGEALLKLRRLYLETGGKLLDWEEIEADVEARRGGLKDS